jgi:cytosine/uracil/thiamine/allantoin permease
MSIGLGIFLVAVGAILVWALNVDVGWIDLDMVGYILMFAGVVVIIVGIALMLRRRQSVSTTHTQVDPASGSQVTRNESSTPEL